MFAVCLPFFVGKAEQALPDAMAGVVSSLVFNPWPRLRQWRGRAFSDDKSSGSRGCLGFCPVWTEPCRGRHCGLSCLRVGNGVNSM